MQLLNMWKIVSTCIILSLVQCESKTCEIWGFETQSYYPIPLFESEKGLLYIDPQDVGSLDIKDGDSMNITCVGSHLEYYGVGFKKQEFATVFCRNGNFFSDEWMPGKEVLFKWVSCSLAVSSIERYPEKSCGENDKAKLVNIHVKSKLHDDHFLYESCFDDSIKQPLYVKNKMSKYNIKHFEHDRVKDFKGDEGVYYDVRIDEFYLTNYQMNLLSEVLGAKFWDYFRDGDRIIVGSLINFNNYPFGPLQDATFNYANAVPMWDKISKGSWLSLNREIKFLLEDKELDVYSGAWGVLTLSDSFGIQKEIKSLESLTSQRYPMPLWLYRVVYEESTKKGIAFLILNNPFVTLNEGKELAKIFPCADVCPDWNWIVNVEAKNGYVTCCEIEDFREVIKDLPEFETVGLLP